ncbi:DUF6527 family protein [Pseudomonas sp.]|uniref:DUF6527 family protein n=1 Tax=Pseudomonas sp. TaxID=306 RepID=UPI00290E5FF7|nr:DUF6527 family protein [Pseudomonas sp.]MDU4254915.1 DUF6527 family protein [Pseudomonas sp.]
MSWNVVEMEENGSIYFDCPGCTLGHCLPVGTGPGPRWQWNGSLDKPTLSPSILARGVERLTDEEVEIIQAGGKVEPRPLVCHSFVRDGRIQFLSDCTHSLAGQTVDLPPVELSK